MCPHPPDERQMIGERRSVCVLKKEEAKAKGCHSPSLQSPKSQKSHNKVCIIKSIAQ